MITFLMNKNWNITFFNENVKNETLSLPDSILANLLRIFDMVKEVGPNLGRPHSAPLSDGLFEFRAKGKEGIARSIFCTVIDNEVVILHTVIKKSNAIPKKDLDLAKKKGIMMSRPTFEDFKKEALLKPSLKEEYENLAPEYELKMKLIEMRKEANLTQEEIC